VEGSALGRTAGCTGSAHHSLSKNKVKLCQKLTASKTDGMMPHPVLRKTHHWDYFRDRREEHSAKYYAVQKKLETDERREVAGSEHRREDGVRIQQGRSPGVIDDLSRERRV